VSGIVGEILCSKCGAEHATTHPANGVTLWFPQPGEAVVRAYGDFAAQHLRLYLDDAYRVVERDTGKRPAAHFTYCDGVMEFRVTETPEVKA
jgi:hypothetical protein